MAMSFYFFKAFARGKVPYPDGFVITTRIEVFAGMVHRDSADPVVVSFEDMQALSSQCVPEPDLLISGSAQQKLQFVDYRQFPELPDMALGLFAVDEPQAL